MVVRDDVILRDHDAAAAGILDFLLLLVSVSVAVAPAVSVTVAVAVAIAEIVTEDVPGVHAAVAVAVAISAAVSVHHLVVVNADHAVPNLGNRLREGRSQHHRFRGARRL